MNKIDLHYCCVVFFAVCQLDRAIWSDFGELLLCENFEHVYFTLVRERGAVCSSLSAFSGASASEGKRREKEGGLSPILPHFFLARFARGQCGEQEPETG